MRRRTWWAGGRVALAVGLAALLAGCSAEPPETVTAEALPAATKAAPAQAPPADAEPEVGGRWHRLRPERVAPELDAEQREMIARLEAIGYASGSREAVADGGVVRFAPEQAFPGYNFYTSGHGPEAVLMDMTGQVLHRWRRSITDVWPDYPRQWLHDGLGLWRRAALEPDGDVIAIFEGAGIIKVDASSQVIWASPVRAHHDFEVMPDGSIYVLTRTPRVIPRIHPTKAVLEDFVTLLDEHGVVQRQVSLLEALERSPFIEDVEIDPDGFLGDIFHTNTLEVLDGSLSDRHPAFAAGNVLVSILMLDLIGVVDLEAERFVWVQRGSFDAQHDPKVLANGRLLLFDNRGAAPHSRVLEFEPGADRFDWVHQGTPEEPFFSFSCGAAERLPNGNTLITESDAGRAFEVTPEHQIVWEFVNPERAGPNHELIATLFEMLRLPADFPAHWAQTQTPTQTAGAAAP